MDMRLGLLVIILLFSNLITPCVVEAKIWYINDYQYKELYKNRSNPPQSSQDETDMNKPSADDTFVCSSYGYLEMTEVGGNYVCASTYTAPDKTCCSNWVCNSTNFPYTSCRSDQTPSGECADKNGTKHYRECKCNTTTYPYTTSNCSYTLSGTSCSDNSGTHYTECYQDPCTRANNENACVEDCDYGCNKRYDGCSSCCIECKTCTPNDCESLGYLTNCPSNAVCNDTCSIGCGDERTFFKPTGCATGYFEPSSYWCDVVISSCEELGYTQSASDCAEGDVLKCPFDKSKVICLNDDPCAEVVGLYCIYGCASHYSTCPSKCQTCDAAPDSCSGYYDCGGTWQYCTGITCSTDSSKCSVSCVEDYFPWSCDDESDCDGVYRDGYCSEECYSSSSSDPCDSATGVSCGTLGCASYGSCGECVSCNADPCDSVTDAGCTWCASYYSSCPSKCETCCDFTGYDKSSCPSYGICDSKTCDGYTKYNWIGCESGMKMGTATCSCDYPSSTYLPEGYLDCNSPYICDVWTCVNGNKYYRISGCEEGYRYSSNGFGNCIAE